MRLKIATAVLSILMAIPSFAKVETFKYAKSVDQSETFTVKADGKEQTVMRTVEPDICIFECDGPTVVEVSPKAGTISKVDVRPLSMDFKSNFDGVKLTLTLEPKQRAVVEFDGNAMKPLFIFANPIDNEKPSPKDPNVRYYKAGKIYYEDEIKLNDSETMYIEGGAIVKTHVKTKKVDNITFAGSGIIDAREDDPMAFNLVRCNNVVIKNITVLNRRSWTTYIAGCNNVEFDNYKLSAEFNPFHKRGLENDGLDIISSSNVSMKHCFSYCHDDAYCIKTDVWGNNGPAKNISYEDCIAWHNMGGNSFELGFAISSEISNVTYKNMYSIHKRYNDRLSRSADISIHCAGKGNVHDISYENIYLEETDNNTINMSIFDNKNTLKAYGYEYTPGAIRDIYLKNIYVLYDQVFGSQFVGYDENHKVENVVIDGIYVKGKKVTDFDELKVKVENATVDIK